jgi:hypothetical protein
MAHRFGASAGASGGLAREMTTRPRAQSRAEGSREIEPSWSQAGATGGNTSHIGYR